MDEESSFWACDPEKACLCTKRFRDSCCKFGGRFPLCDGTFDMRAARTDENGEPIPYKEWKKKQEGEKK